MRLGAQAWRSARARPTITYFDLMMLLDNETGMVTEWSESGEKRSRA
jgi:hypothetical protein